MPAAIGSVTRGGAGHQTDRDRQERTRTDACQVVARKVLSLPGLRANAALLGVRIIW